MKHVVQKKISLNKIISLCGHTGTGRLTVWTLDQGPFHNLGGGLHWYHNHVFCFSKIDMRVEKKTFYDLICFTIWPYWPNPRVCISDPRAMNVTILVKAFMPIITLHLGFFPKCVGAEMKMFENLAFFLFGPAFIRSGVVNRWISLIRFHVP